MSVRSAASVADRAQPRHQHRHRDPHRIVRGDEFGWKAEDAAVQVDSRAVPPARQGTGRRDHDAPEGAGHLARLQLERGRPPSSARSAPAWSAWASSRARWPRCWPTPAANGCGATWPCSRWAACATASTPPTRRRRSSTCAAIRAASTCSSRTTSSSTSTWRSPTGCRWCGGSSSSTWKGLAAFDDPRVISLEQLRELGRIHLRDAAAAAGTAQPRAQPVRRGGAGLHLGHHRPAQGRDDQPGQHLRGAGRAVGHAVRGPAARRRAHRLPAAVPHRRAHDRRVRADRARLDRQLRREPGDGVREPARGAAAACSSPCRACGRRSIRRWPSA